MSQLKTDVLESGQALPQPHGGRLVNRILTPKRREAILTQIDEMPSIIVDNETVMDIRNIAEGVFSPLEGFMERQDFLQVIHEGRLADETPWTIPIILDIPIQRDCANLQESDTVSIRNRLQQPIAVLTITDKYNFDKKETAQLIFGTNNSSHPGVAKILTLGDKLIGGPIDLLAHPETRFEAYHLSPSETREIFNKRNWKTIAGFQTRNIPHLGHEYLQKTALTLVHGLFINPIIGKKKRGDFKDEVILDAYEALIVNYFPQKSVVLGVLQTEMRYAGPKEAIFHAIIRKNFGCTHFIVGRDHAGVGDFYPPYASHEIFNEFSDLGITPLCFPSIFFCDVCKTITSDKACPHSQKCRQEFSGSKIRVAIENGDHQNPSLRPEVAETVKKWQHPFS
jgi:sulfate adenylyltransferase